MSAPATRWASGKRAASVRTDPARPETPAGAVTERAGSPKGPGAAPPSVEAAISPARTAGSSFIAADPGVSTARGDFGFRSLSDVDNPPDPQTGKIVSRWLGRFQLESGAVLPDLVVAYRHDGVAVGEGRQILVVHALTGSADAAGDWWAPLIGPGQILDTDKFGVICMNLLGSRYGTSGPTSRNPATGKPYGRTFPRVTVRDQARAQWRLLDALGIGKLALAVGGSLGGMVALEVALERPGEISRVVPIAAPARIGQLAVGWDHHPAGYRRQARHRRPGPGPPAGDHHLSQRDRLRAAFRRPNRGGRHAFDRQLPAAPGPKAPGAVRSGHVSLARAGDGYARHRPRPRRRSSRSAAAGRIRNTPDRRRHRGRHPLRHEPG